MSFIRSEIREALLVAIVLCFGCSSTESGGGSAGGPGQSAGGAGQGGASGAQSGGAREDAGDGGDSAGSAGDSEPGMGNGGTSPALGGTGGTSSNGESGGHEAAGSGAMGGSSGRDECVWDPVSTDQCPVCDSNGGCARPGYKYIGSGAVTASCCGLQWQEATAPGNYTWSEAADYCASLSLLGRGWRLPKIAELYSLVDLSDESHSSPTINVEALADTLREAYWSSSLDGKSGQAVWSVNFSDGASESVQIQQSHRVRCVR